MSEHGGLGDGQMIIKMRKFMRFLHQTFIGHEKNRRDVLDYLRAAVFFTGLFLLVWAVMHYLFDFH